MKRRTIAIKTISLVLMVACATVFIAAPAFAANINQISITELSAALSEGEPVPPARMFSEGLDFEAAVRLPDVNGREVYLNTARQLIYKASDGTFFDASVGENVVPADLVFGPAYMFPSDGNQYTFTAGENPHPGFELRGRGPHGGYTTTSAKCATCHSAHSAVTTEDPNDVRAPGSSSVNLASRANASLTRAGSTGCEYCHLTGTPIGAAGMSSRVVYTGGIEGGTSNMGEDISGHSLFQPNMVIPNSAMVDTSGNPIMVSGQPQPVVLTDGLTCATCHAVHGNVGTWQPEEFFRGVGTGTFAQGGAFSNDETVDELSYRMLRVSPAGVANPNIAPAPTEPADPSSPLVYATDTNQINQFTMGTWCSSCHNAPGMNKVMESTTASGATFEEMMDSLPSTFTVNNADVHSVDGGFAASYPADAPDLPEEAHPSTFVGVYSGPGQCYTCHRGDLGGPLNAQWTLNGSPVAEWELGAELAPDPDAPTDLDTLARFRALGYFALDSGTAQQQLDQQARNLACSSCHFGTADYARWSLMSDWPHRSADSDVMLLGLDLNSTELSQVGDSGNATRLPASLASERFCSRCHISINDASAANMFAISHHYLEHNNINNEETTVTLFSPLSPGNEPTGAAGSGSSIETTP